jgi:hypothetical protein
MVRNMCCPHKDCSSFLGGKLIVFKLCNYAIALAKVSHVIFEIASAYFIVYEAYFSRTIRTASVYFIVYALFSCLWLV